ncbi:hypothetical protein FISHEDRAFT_70378 [Fistulina hepatica ATCC 64428]|uniref:Uncharacterized protein n=1 Tax=Fistulina hepatica ATCC 64428 TaxID=1128425 RepID=A0A0D7AKQ4_9AGAR|nr:hypothetical protein FISHEDRAFT_70378 [Fistulina hepatica ATCC 64428]
MAPAYEPIPSIDIPIPNLAGLAAIARNILIFNDWLAVEYHASYMTALVVLVCFPELFTWPVIALKTIFGAIFGVVRWTVQALGFGSEGVRRGSFAASYQHTYGGYVPGYSLFSRAQSYGAISDPSVLVLEEVPTPLPLYATLLRLIAVTLVMRGIFFL